MSRKEQAKHASGRQRKARVIESRDLEFSALAAVVAALSPLDDDARQRVVDYVINRYKIDH